MTIVEPLSSKVLPAPQKAPHVIAVTSGKGGVGKSSISVNLGIALSRMGRRVCIFDADTGLANINILLGLTPRYSLEHVLFGTRSIADVMLAAPHNLKVIPGANGITECVNLQPRQQLQLTRELAQVEKNFDYLLMDTAAGISETTLDFARAAQQTLLVITPEPTSLTDAFSLVKLLARRGKRSNFHVVVNMCSSAGQARGVYQRFAGAVSRYIGVQPAYLGYLLQDESLRAAVTMQSPVTLFPETDPSCRSFFRLSQSLEAALQDITPAASFSAYWQSLYRQRRRDDVPRTSFRQAPASDAAPEKLQGYLNGLRTRLLTLMAQGSLPAGAFQDLIGDLRSAMETHFPAGAMPVEEKAVVDQEDGGQQQAHGAKPPRPSDTAEMTTHGYDAGLFGSQAQLLDLLRGNRGQTLCEQLEMIRQARDHL